MDARGFCYQALSLLLTYPDAHAQAALPSLADALAQWPQGRFKSGLEEILANMADRPPLRLQEAYTAAFDLDPGATLNLTYHLWRDSEKRSAALARLQALYRESGWETTTGELPDYLPLMLEFLAVCPEARSNDLILTIFACLPELTDRVRSKAPLYAALLALLDGVVHRDGMEAADAGAPLRKARADCLTSQRRPS